ncbi:hypothetical protein JCM10914A_24300 [Paenibacillus sp. JCM 10914]
MGDRGLDYRRIGLVMVLCVGLLMLTAACTVAELPAEDGAPIGVQQDSGESKSGSVIMANDAVQKAGEERNESNTQNLEREIFEVDLSKIERTAIETVILMYEALQAKDKESYFQHADIPSMRISPAKLEVMMIEAGRRELRPERFMLLDRSVLDPEKLSLLALTYGSQAEVVLEELSHGDRHLWFVNEFPDGPRVVDQNTIYPGAYELGRDAGLEELINVGIEQAAENRRFLAVKSKKPIMTPMQTVSMLYQAAQDGDESTFYQLSGGDEGYFAGRYAQDMVEFSEWMKAFESVQRFPMEDIPRAKLAGAYRADYNERFGSEWQVVVAWDPREESGYMGTSWIMAPGMDGIRYVVKQALTADLKSFLSDEYIRVPQG